MCCGRTAQSKRRKITPPLSAPSSTSTSAVNGRLPELVETTCQYSSVQSLIQEIKTARNAEMEAILKNNTFVGIVDCYYSLVQHGTKLHLVDHSHLLRDMYYQLALRKFAEMDYYRLSSVVPLDAFLHAALSEEVESGRLDANSANPSSGPCPGPGGLEAMATAAANLLVSKAPLLEEYFNIRIDAEQRTLTALPVLLRGVTPLPEELPSFLLTLATSTNWDDETECFRTVSLALADYYSQIATEYPTTASAADPAVAFPVLNMYLYMLIII
jgi:DNA mismatch repair protein MLH1